MKKQDHEQFDPKKHGESEPTFMEVMLYAMEQYAENVSTKAPAKPRKLTIEHIPTIMEELTNANRMVIEDLKEKMSKLFKGHESGVAKKMHHNKSDISR